METTVAGPTVQGTETEIHAAPPRAMAAAAAAAPSRGISSADERFYALAPLAPPPPPLALEPNDLDELRQRFELIADELRQRADALSHALDLVEGELERERNKSKAVLNRLGKLEKAMSDLDFHAAWLEQFVSDAGLMN